MEENKISRTKQWANNITEKRRKEKEERNRIIFNRIQLTTMQSFIIINRNQENVNLKYKLTIEAETELLKNINHGLGTCKAPIFSPCGYRFPIGVEKKLSDLLLVAKKRGF